MQTTKAGTVLKMYIEPTQVRFVKDKKDVVMIPASVVTEISYGQDVHRRIGTAVNQSYYAAAGVASRASVSR